MKFILILLVLSPLSLQASVQEDTKLLFDSIQAHFQQEYANEEIKHQRYEWSIDDSVTELRERAINRGELLTEAEAQSLVREFFQSTRDYHAGLYGDNWGGKEAPFRLVEMNGTAFITAILDPALTGDMRVGDEVLSFDHRSVRDVAQDFQIPKKYSANFAYETRDSNVFLTTRYLAMGHLQPKEPKATLLLRHSLIELPFIAEVSWQDMPTKTTVQLQNKSTMSGPGALFNLDQPLEKRLLIDAPTVHDPFRWGGAISYFTPDPAAIWHNDPTTSRFHAWIGNLPSGKRLGSIRIRGFQTGDFKKAVEEFEQLVDKMNKDTDVLILDTLGNTGGSFDYLYALLSYFFSEKIKTLEFQYRLSPSLVKAARETIAALEGIKTQDEVIRYFKGDHLNGFPVDLDLVQDMIHFHQGLVDASEAGEKFGPKRHYNAEFIKPNPRVQYLKPLFVLTDDASVSGGEMFAMILKDTKRGKILGHPTAGAGGFSSAPISLTPRLGVSTMYIPIGVGYRLNGELVEDHGLVPDVRIDVENEDFVQNFKFYRMKVLQAIEEIL